jgi:SH3-like domain-containing protein
MARFTANSDYEETDSNPIRLRPGDELTPGEHDRAWPGWLWVSDGQGNDGYVPKELLQSRENGSFIATEAFDPTVLRVRRGDSLESLREVHGWHWCRATDGREGWVAGYLLTPS